MHLICWRVFWKMWDDSDEKIEISTEFSIMWMLIPSKYICHFLHTLQMLEFINCCYYFYWYLLMNVMMTFIFFIFFYKQFFQTIKKGFGKHIYMWCFKKSEPWWNTSDGDVTRILEYIKIMRFSVMTNSVCQKGYLYGSIVWTLCAF